MPRFIKKLHMKNIQEDALRQSHRGGSSYPSKISSLKDPLATATCLSLSLALLITTVQSGTPSTWKVWNSTT